MKMSDMELEAAAEVLKQFGDNEPTWHSMQKEIYKTVVDAAKEGAKRQLHG